MFEITSTSHPIPHVGAGVLLVVVDDDVVVLDVVELDVVVDDVVVVGGLANEVTLCLLVRVGGIH